MPYKIPNDEWANPISIKLAYNWVNFTVSLSPFTYSFPSVALLLRSWFSIILFHSSIEFLIILRLLVGSFRVLYIMLFYLSKWWNVLSNYFWRIYRMHCLSEFFFKWQICMLKLRFASHKLIFILFGLFHIKLFCKMSDNSFQIV